MSCVVLPLLLMGNLVWNDIITAHTVTGFGKRLKQITFLGFCH